jgi:hypothetical protein
MALHIVRQRRELEGLRGVRLELEDPVARAHEVVGVPVGLDPGERPLFELAVHRVVTGLDWRR